MDLPISVLKDKICMKNLETQNSVESYSRDYAFECVGDRNKRGCKGGYIYDFLYDT